MSDKILDPVLPFPSHGTWTSAPYSEKSELNNLLCPPPSLKSEAHSDPVCLWGGRSSALIGDGAGGLPEEAGARVTLFTVESGSLSVVPRLAATAPPRQEFVINASSQAPPKPSSTEILGVRRAICVLRNPPSDPEASLNLESLLQTLPNVYAVLYRKLKEKKALFPCHGG